MGVARRIWVNEEYCKGCSICVYVCPSGVLEMSPGLSRRGVHPPAVKALEKCTGCRSCEISCPDFAIAVEEGDDAASEAG